MASFMRARGSKLFFDSNRDREKPMQRGETGVRSCRRSAAAEPACFELERFPCSFADGLDMLATTCAAEQGGKLRMILEIRYSPELV